MRAHTTDTTILISDRPVLAQRFELIDTIGEGAAGAVFRVLDRNRSNIEVALKVLTNTSAFDENTLQRFIEEVNACQGIRHPNIIKAYDFINLNDCVAYTMEYIDGKDLSQIYDQGVFSAQDIDDIFLQLLSGLSELHLNGIIHRDIKLENVLLTQDGVVKLADLGLIKRLDVDKSLTRTGVLLGTAQYMPPEYVRGAVYDARSDLYAVGLVLYELLSGKRRLQGMKGLEAIDELLRSKFKVPRLESGINGPVCDKHNAILEHALEPRPRRRFQSADEMREAFKAPLDTKSFEVKSAIQQSDPQPSVTNPVKQGMRIHGIEPEKSLWPAIRQSLTAIALIVLGVCAWILWGSAQFAPIKVYPGSYHGQYQLNGNALQTRSMRSEVSAGGVFVVVNLERCRSGFVNPSSDEIGCSTKGIQLRVQVAADTMFSGEIVNTQSGAHHPFLLSRQ